MKKPEELTEEQIKHIEYIVTLKRISGADVNLMYKVYRDIYQDKGFLCNRCSRVVRNVWEKVKQYYQTYLK